MTINGDGNLANSSDTKVMVSTDGGPLCNFLMEYIGESNEMDDNYENNYPDYDYFISKITLEVLNL